MEHNDDLNIRKKILDWEEETYPLDKDNLWNRLPEPLAPSRTKQWFFYYAAATLVLAATILYSSWQEAEYTLLHTRLAEAEQALAEARQAATTAGNTVTSLPCPEFKTPVEKPKRAHKARRVVPEPSLVKLEEPRPAERQPIVTETENTLATTLPGETPLEEIPVAPVQRRVVLAGPMPSEKSQSRGRIRLSLFGNEDLSDAKQNSTNTPVALAGINH